MIQLHDDNIWCEQHVYCCLYLMFTSSWKPFLQSRPREPAVWKTEQYLQIPTIFLKGRNSKGNMPYVSRIARDKDHTCDRNVTGCRCYPAPIFSNHNWLEQVLLILQRFSVVKVSQNQTKFIESFTFEVFWPIWVLKLAIFYLIGTRG